MPETPAGVEAPRPGSPGLGLKFVGALLEAARCRLGDVIQQAEILQEALQELQRNRLASMPGGCKGPESSAVGQEYNVDGSAASPSLAWSGPLSEGPLGRGRGRAHLPIKAGFRRA
ncbi:uncharacterized protein LOC110215297 isoform X2 [Phascolarctos cinereus]